MKIYTNRELSWLKFNQRVLEETEKKGNALCERLNFLSIFQSNLDEFYMVRVGSLEDQHTVCKDMKDSKTDMTPSEQIHAINKSTARMIEEKDTVCRSLLKEMNQYGISLVSFSDLKNRELDQLEREFTHNIAPVTSPYIVSHRQPFPFLQNKEIYAVAFLRSRSGQKRTGIVPCNTGITSRLIKVSDTDEKYILREDIILHFISRLFEGFTVESRALIRITRNADIDADALYDDDLDYREFMTKIIRKRKRLSPVRMEYYGKLREEEIQELRKYIKVRHDSVFPSSSPLDLSFLSFCRSHLSNHQELFFPKYVPHATADFPSEKHIFSLIREKDRLLSFPYESMKPFLNMLKEASEDPDVISIRMTLYRVAHHSKIIEYLIDASENGKDVQVLVELKARFDEENNIECSRRMEEAGIQVIYGLEGYKVHSKLCIITRKNEQDVEYYTQIGTGNYNENTAKLYTDLSYFTCSTSIGKEAITVFQSLAKGETVHHTDRLLVAPHCLQNRILEMIDEEIAHAKSGENAYIGIKINSLTDKTIMEKLITASQAGVHIDLIVRGICCLLPGIPDVTDNIRVISIVGRFLEHSRIYIFRNNNSKKVFISSADFMSRNTLRRVEIAVPIEDEECRKRVTDIFETMLKDNVNARIMSSSGDYYPVFSDNPFNSQTYFMEQAYRNTKEETEEKHSIWNRIFRRVK